MFLDGKPACVLDEGRVYNCTGLDADPQKWIARVCEAAITRGWAETSLPLACRAPTMGVGGPAWPRVHGHSFGSTNPRASADFVIKYFGATLVKDDAPKCDHDWPAGTGTAPPREVTVRLPFHSDYRGGGLLLRFVSDPRKPGGSYDIARHVEAMGVLYGDLSGMPSPHPPPPWPSTTF